jgi:ribose transport system ATP-binding protein
MTPPLIEFRDIGKRFFGVEVLHGINLSLSPGRILGLVGENGAGKSTLMNILGGVHAPDAGSMRLGGQPYAPRQPRDARAAGIAFVHQELSLFTNLSIAENLHLEAFPRRRIGSLPLPFVDYASMQARTRQLLQEVSVQRRPTDFVADLSPGERQLVEIARAVNANARLLILDEPTTSLTATEVQSLFAIIRRLKERGVAIIYISHRLQDVRELADDIAVLRDGGVVSTGPASGYDEERIISEMVGRSVGQFFAQRPASGVGDPLLQLEGIARGAILRDISFTLHRGEILGIAGLMGAGRTELARVIFGLDRHDRGRVLYSNQPLHGGPRQRIALGIAFLTEDRRHEGLLMDDSVQSNAALASLRDFAKSPLKLMHRRAIRTRVAHVAQSVHLRGVDPAVQATRTLSGGNQQKVVLAKWLMNPPKLLLLDEPTRGIDVGAKQEIYRIIDELAKAGTAILMISSEIEELIALADRILVLRRGAIVDEMPRGGFDRQRILRAALGGEARS